MSGSGFGNINSHELHPRGRRFIKRGLNGSTLHNSQDRSHLNHNRCIIQSTNPGPPAPQRSNTPKSSARRPSHLQPHVSGGTRTPKLQHGQDKQLCGCLYLTQAPQTNSLPLSHPHLHPQTQFTSQQPPITSPTPYLITNTTNPSAESTSKVEKSKQKQPPRAPTQPPLSGQPARTRPGMTPGRAVPPAPSLSFRPWG